VRDPFDLNVVEDVPTPDQVQTMLEYVKEDEVGQIVDGAGTVTEALRRFKMDKESFKRPVVCLSLFFWSYLLEFLLLSLNGS
jgi:hypothetical protein